jgi:hypothetical protein
MTVCHDLDATANPARTVFHKFRCPPSIATAHHIAHAQLGISIQSYPRPNVSPPSRLLLWRGILGFRSNKGPNFIALESASLDVPHIRIVEGIAGCAEINQQFCDGVNGNIGETAGSPETVSLNEHSEDCGTLLKW